MTHITNGPFDRKSSLQLQLAAEAVDGMRAQLITARDKLRELRVQLDEYDVAMRMESTIARLRNLVEDCERPLRDLHVELQRNERDARILRWAHADDYAEVVIEEPTLGRRSGAATGAIASLTWVGAGHQVYDYLLTIPVSDRLRATVIMRDCAPETPRTEASEAAILAKFHAADVLDAFPQGYEPVELVR